MRSLSAKSLFSRSALTYHENANIQRETAAELVEGIKQLEAEHILELGCGTGVCTELLLERFSRSKITATDFAPGMIAAAKERLGEGERLVFREEDFSGVLLEQRCDLLVSNAALHWVPDLTRAFSNMNKCLNSGGKLAAAIMLEGTLSELHQARLIAAPQKKPKRNMPSFGLVEQAVVESGFSIESISQKTFVNQHEHASAFLRSIRALGLTSGDISQGEALLNRTELKELERVYNERFCLPEGGVKASYEVCFVFAA